MLSVKFKKLTPEAVIPSRGTAGSAGFDLTTIEKAVINPGDTVRIRTGIAAAIPVGYVGLVKPRSSVFFKGFDLDGTIDSDYRGEILLQVRNLRPDAAVIEAGSRVAQMVVVQFMAVSEEVLVLSDTERGEGGFGSTNK
jgi:dUTP pyrophosphatase